MTDRVLPALDTFGPDLILISAGFDAHEGDPLGHIRLLEPDFEWITYRVMDVASKHCDSRIVSMLEGGYGRSPQKECGNVGPLPSRPSRPCLGIDHLAGKPVAKPLRVLFLGETTITQAPSRCRAARAWRREDITVS
jgi:hypothetical protein